MTPSNFQDAIRFFVCRQPFRPFVVELVNGRRYRIDRPKDLQLQYGSACCTLQGEEGKVCIFDPQSVCLVCDDEAAPDLLIDRPDFLDLDQ